MIAKTLQSGLPPSIFGRDRGYTRRFRGPFEAAKRQSGNVVIVGCAHASCGGGQIAGTGRVVAGAAVSEFNRGAPDRDTVRSCGWPL